MVLPCFVLVAGKVGSEEEFVMCHVIEYLLIE